MKKPALILLLLMHTTSASADENVLLRDMKSTEFLYENCKQNLGEDNFLESYCAATLNGFLNGFIYSTFDVKIGYRSDDERAKEIADAKQEIVDDIRYRLCFENIDSTKAIAEKFVGFYKTRKAQLEAEGKSTEARKHPAYLGLISFFWWEYPRCKEK